MIERVFLFEQQLPIPELAESRLAVGPRHPPASACFFLPFHSWGRERAGARLAATKKTGSGKQPFEKTIELSTKLARWLV